MGTRCQSVRNQYEGPSNFLGCLKNVFVSVVLFVMLLTFPTSQVHGAQQPQPPSISAKAAALIDVESGRLLYSKQGDTPMLIASITKIMTAIVAIEHGRLSDLVKVSDNAYGKEGSSLYLQQGEEMSLEHLLYGMMLRSGNDAATAIAEHVGGSVEGFVHLMNEKATQIGMTNSHFVNPHGLDAEGHQASANDMAKLTAYALHNPIFREIVSTSVKTAPNPNEKWDYRWRNKNKMLHLYEGADGVKTGYTKAAGRTLVSSATRNGQQLVVVTLNDPDDWSDHMRLLDFGFEHYPLQTVVEKGEPLSHTPFVPLSSFYYPLTDDENDLIKLQFHKVTTDSLDDRMGIRGSLHILVDGETVGVVDMVEPDDERLAQTSSSFVRTVWQEEKTLWDTYGSVMSEVWQACVDVLADPDI